MDRKIHWDKAYAAGAPERLGWYRPHLSASLELIERTGIEKKARLIDVGGGASTLVDDLLDPRFENMMTTIAASSIASLAKTRLVPEPSRASG